METLYTEIFYDVKKNKSISQIKDELSNIAETSHFIPDEFIADLFGLISHFWSEGGTRRKYADQKIEAVQPHLPKDLVVIVKTSSDTQGFRPV